MTLCPVALVSGCKNCVIFQACPLKSIIGDHKKDASGSEQSGGKPGDKGTPG
jgi:hypothetical protein